MPKTEAQCRADGWNWDGKKCSEPNVGNVKMAIGRGDGCDGKTRIVTLRRRLPRDLRLALIKAAKGIKGTPARRKKNKKNRPA
jgi:hypothetical protein